MFYKIYVADIIIGISFMQEHTSLTIDFGGTKPNLSVCGLTSAKINPPSLFGNLTTDCQPIRTKSRRFNQTEQRFITEEISKLLWKE